MRCPSSPGHGGASSPGNSCWNFTHCTRRPLLFPADAAFWVVAEAQSSIPRSYLAMARFSELLCFREVSTPFSGCLELIQITTSTVGFCFRAHGFDLFG